MIFRFLYILGSVEVEQKKEMVVHAAHSDLCKTDVETLKDELRRRNMPSAHILNTTYQQVPDVNRSLTSPCSPPDQRSPQSTLDNKLLPTPPAYTPSPLSTVAAAAAAGNFPAAIAALAATQTANPFLLAAALGLQQPQNASSTLPWISNAQSFTAMLPYFQHLQAQVQQQAQAQVALAQQIAAQQAANLHQQFKTVAAAAAAAHTSLLSQQQQQHQQQTQLHSQWLSPPPSVPPQISATKQTTTCPSPLLPSGAELTSSLLEFTELSPRLHPEPQPPSPPASSSSSLYNDEKQQQLQQQQFLFDEDLMIDSLMEERKDLSEKESIAVAVLAGMAACQR
ncbi:unnamed protein product [Cercopithifilaria johnstoni]|uniref:Uncharacterized protein n=1 Tax=Cercopithifilaria johnstoni TaxID=2874296 RepID=A0A8J2MP17_9BILA|nr:unnamed protein product [Cercopithifilaria johnstoni]